MGVFTKVCAVLAGLVGIVFILLGAFGLFTGCSFRFSLPPIAGVLPALVGWGILKSVWVAWHAPRRAATPFGAASPGAQADGPKELPRL